MRLVFRKNALLSKLADELFASGLVSPLREDGTPSIYGTSEEVWVFIPDNTPQEVIDQITAIVTAHDPTPPPPTLQSLKMTTDKTQITADGVDTASITITLEPAGTGITTVDVLVDGPPVTEVEVTNNQATFEFTATDPGKYMIECISGEVRKHIFVEAV